MDEAASPRGDTRAQSNVLGLALLIGIVVVGTVSVVAFGSTVLGDARSDAQIDSAEQAMTKLDSTASLVALGRSETQRARISLRGVAEQVRVDEDEGWLRIRVVDPVNGSIRTTIVNRTLGTVTYENEGTEIAYQGGGVWKRTGGGTTMVSPPEVHYRGTTLTLPLVTVNGSGRVGGDMVVRDAGNRTQHYPSPTNSSLRNPLRNGEVNVTVNSEYYEAWARFFRSRTTGGVTVDEAAQTVTLTLAVERSNPPVTGGLVVTSSGGTLDLQNNNAVDSYSSADGDGYEAEENGTIVTPGTVSLGNNALIEGDLVVGQDVIFGNNAEVRGNVAYGGTASTSSGNDPPASYVTGWLARNASVQEASSAGPLIDQKGVDLASANDNGATAAVVLDGGDYVLDNDGSAVQVPAGDYYLDNLNAGGNQITLNTTGGDVSVYVDGDIDFDGSLDVVGNGTARLYLNGDLDLGSAQLTSQNATTSERSTGLWFYMRPGSEAAITNGARFVGVVYGPASESQAGVRIELQGNSEVYGGLVGDIPAVPNQVQIHFDEALVGEDPFAGVTSLPTVTYLHVSTSTVNVTETGAA